MITPAYAPSITNPRLALDFTTGSLDPRVTVSRLLNTATRINSNGYVEIVNANLPRFDYDSLTLAPKGLLIEEARTNLLTYSEQFDNAAWTKSAVTITANAITAPDSATTADKSIATTFSGVHYFRSLNTIVTVTAGQVYTSSIFAKAGEISKFNISCLANLPAATFDLVAKTATGLSGSTATITELKNGWFCCTATRTAPGSGGDGVWIQSWNAAGTSTSFVGNAVDGIYFWGAQLELGAFATSYIPTTTATVTRNADVVTMVGSSFSDWWQAGKGAALVRAFPNTVSGTRPLMQFDDTTANNIIALRGNTTNPELYVRTSGVDQTQIDAGTIAASTSYRLAGAWATNSCAASVNSGATVLDGVATIPVVTQARLGSDGTNYLNGYLQSIEYYNERLPNSTLQVISSTAGYQSIISPVISDAIIS